MLENVSFIISAQVTELTAKLHEIRLGSRKLTRSMVDQLDDVQFREMHIMGRYKVIHDSVLTHVGAVGVHRETRDLVKRVEPLQEIYDIELEGHSFPDDFKVKLCTIERLSYGAYYAHSGVWMVHIPDRLVTPCDCRKVAPLHTNGSQVELPPYASYLENCCRSLPPRYIAEWEDIWRAENPYGALVADAPLIIL